MLEFLLGAAGAGLVFSLVGAVNDYRDKQKQKQTTDEPTSKMGATEFASKTAKEYHPHLQEIFSFFEDAKKAEVTIKQNYSGLKIENKQVSLYLYESPFEVGIKHVHFYVGFNNVINIVYDMPKKRFKKFDELENILTVDALDVFSLRFQFFMEAFYQKKDQKNVLELLNSANERTEVLIEESVESLTEEAIASWKAYVPLIKQAQVQRVLMELDDLLKEVNLHQKEFDIEEKHRLNRVEDDILPKLLHSFTSLKESEQSKYEVILVKELGDVKEKMEQLNQFIVTKSERDFQKNIELIKHV